MSLSKPPEVSLNDLSNRLSAAGYSKPSRAAEEFAAAEGSSASAGHSATTGATELDDTVIPFRAGDSEGAPGSDEMVKSKWTGPTPDLSLLSQEIGEAPTFPLEVLGDFWKGWCTASARNANAPVDYTVGTLLASVGALLGNVRWPDVEGVWEHPSVLWIGLVGNPSTAKSPGMRPVRKLINAVENARANAIDDAGPQHRLMAFVAECAEREWKREVENTIATRTVSDDAKSSKRQSKAKDRGAAATSAAEGPYGGLPMWPKEAQIPETPVQPVLHVVDATIEALITTSAGSPRGLLQFSDELAGWFGGFDRYRSKGVSADRPFWLKAFDGDPYSVMRKGGDLKNGVRAPIEIRHLSIGVIGSVQPDPLRRFLTNTDDGLAHRFLWMWPERTTKFHIPRKSDTGPKADDDGALGAFLALDALTTAIAGEPTRVQVASEATDLLEEYGQTIMDRSANVSAWYASALGKAPGLALRLSLVLAYLRWSANADQAEPTQIGAGVMAAAIELMESYFLPQSERVRDCASVGDGETDARALIALLRKLGEERVTGRMIHRNASGRLADTRIRKATLEILVEAGLLREDFQRAGGTAGRMKEWYLVHPRVLDPDAPIAIDGGLGGRQPGEAA